METNMVVVVDDHDDSRDFVREFLEYSGHTVRAFGDAESALAALGTMPRPSVIVLDLFMPRMDGMELLRELRGQPALAGIPVIVMSGSHEDAKKAGVPFLFKPLNPDALLRAVRQHARPREVAEQAS